MRFLVFSLLFCGLWTGCIAPKKTANTIPPPLPMTGTDLPMPVYDSFLVENEVSVHQWYQGMLSRRADGRYVERLFYPEKSLLVSIKTYKTAKMDTLDGPYQTWFDNGYSEAQGQYKDGLKTGYWTYTDLFTGAVTAAGRYKADQCQGLWKNYIPTSGERYEMTWKDDLREGPFVRYDKTGAVLNKGRYCADTLVEQLTELDPNRFESGQMIFTYLEDMPYMAAVDSIVDPIARRKASGHYLKNYLDRTITYPRFARTFKIEGRAVFYFTVYPDGHVGDITTAHGLSVVLERECLRALIGMPKWKPGRLHGKPVRVRYYLPFRFKLQ